MSVAIYGVGLGAFLAVLGWATYSFAPRVGPNLLFGVRLGYTLADRRVWDRSNRIGGLLLAALGAGHGLLGITLGLLGLGLEAGVLALAGTLVLSLLAMTIFLALDAREMARHLAIVVEAQPIRVGWRLLFPVLTAFGALLLLTVIAYPALPEDKIATHFDLRGVPNGWMSREMAVAGPLAAGLLLAAIPVLLVVGARKSPALFAIPSTQRWSVEPRRILQVVAVAMTFGEVIILFAMLDIIWFAVNGSHLVDTTLAVVILVLLAVAAGPLVLLFLFADRRAQPR